MNMLFSILLVWPLKSVAFKMHQVALSRDDQQLHLVGLQDATGNMPFVDIVVHI
jgi:hypothetical protein